MVTPRKVRRKCFLFLLESTVRSAERYSSRFTEVPRRTRHEASLPERRKVVASMSVAAIITEYRPRSHTDVLVVKILAAADEARNERRGNDMRGLHTVIECARQLSPSGAATTTIVRGRSHGFTIEPSLRRYALSVQE